MLCDSLEEWDGVGIAREAQEGTHIRILMADSYCTQKPTQCCKAITFQLKKKKVNPEQTAVL